MKKDLRSILLVITCAIMSSCHYSSEYQLVNANNKFSIAVPGWMKQVNNLKPGADFQYANRYRNFYAIGEVEPNNESISRQMNDNLNILRTSLKNPVVTDSVDTEVGGLKGVRVEIYGKMSNENIYFTEMLIEGKSNLYHLSVWTRGEDRKLRFKDDINHILSSFKEI